MLFFAKTCARDAERVAYQVAAVARLGCDHVVLVEDADFDVVERAIRAVCGELPRTLELARLEKAVRTATGVANPYARQMYCKLVAPLIWGDMLQVDSDMCPFAWPRWAAHGDRRACWHWRRGYGARLEVLHAWSATYRAVTRILAPPVTAACDYMGPCKGWWITHALAEAFLKVAEGAPGLRKAVVRPQFSEYQSLGLFARSELPDAYTWVEGEQPAWCHHFTSTEPLEPAQRAQLVRAATSGGDRCR